MPKTKSSRSVKNTNGLNIYPLLKSFIDEKVPMFEELPYDWRNVDLESFSSTKKLWDFQIEALKYAIRGLYYYYDVLKADKERFWDELITYDNALDLPSIMDIKKSESDVWKILSKYFYSYDDNISYSNFINRMGFWMATGSGKTLVIVKLIDILITYMERELIPSRYILFLTYRDDLIEQFKVHFEEFNKSQRGKILKLYELKEFHRTINSKKFFEYPIFYYRSDNISDEQKDKIINYELYENFGNWYVILDEAHKGDKESSKSQQYFSILSRNGFLFNFSATFTDPRDILTTAYEFNLSTFIENGYGKEIRIFDENVKIKIKNNGKIEDFNENEKYKIILKTLILLAYLRKKSREIRYVPELNLEYHSPLAVFLVNSVNTEDSDLKLLFRLIKEIASEKGYEKILNSEIFEDAKKSIIQNSPINPFDENHSFSGSNITKEELLDISPSDILREVFNSETRGEIEIVKSKSEKELALKLMTSETPFALIKIGDTNQLLNSLINEFNLRIQETFADEEFFSNLDEKEQISMLLGSRAFYEGWDSNRPNVIVFINIGTGDAAKKFVLQSIGRGLRVQPIKNGDRKRLGMMPEYSKYKSYILPIETLFVWGTKADTIETIIEGTKKIIENSGVRIELKKNIERIDGHKLFVPTYRKVRKIADFEKMLEDKKIQKYVINSIDFEDTKSVLDNISDEMLYFFYLTNEDEPVERIKILRKLFEDSYWDNFFRKDNNKKRLGWFECIKDIFRYINNQIIFETIPDIEECEEPIIHYKGIKIKLPREKEINEVREAIEEVYNEEYEKKISITGKGKYEIEIDFIKEHYFIPVIKALDKEAVKNLLANILREESEIDFIDELKRKSKHFERFDWWLFSKVIQKVDEIYIPYTNDDNGALEKFYPDFVFWFKKDNKYLVAFVDPKSTEFTSGYRKIDGFIRLFYENDKPKIFEKDGFKVIFDLYLYNKKAAAPEKYQDFWIKNIEELAERLTKRFDNMP
ncbi:MAG TPA: DEAD/DEAH box helicase family protein [Defluviitoga tunisiensis]|nr:DEAD/DEAH box helicase family protein [Defluviitoga tunisiensis]